MEREQFIKIISKYTDLDKYDIKFKKSPYYKNENEMWLYSKKDDGQYKNVVVGYRSSVDDKIYKNKKELPHGGYYRVREQKKYRQGLLITEDTILDEKYLEDYLNEK